MIQNLSYGINKVFRAGNTVIKHVAAGGSPHAEVAASKAMQLLGVPSNPVRYRQIKRPVELREPGVGFHELHHHVITSPYLSMRPINKFYEGGDVSHLGPMMNTKPLMDTLLAEWVNSISDRHGGNYALVPGKGIMSIDHGQAFHPGTHEWPRVQSGEPMQDWAKLANNPTDMSDRPAASALHHLIYDPYDERTHGVHTDQTLAHRALQHQDQLEQLAYEATQGLPPQERDLAKVAMRLRLNVLEHYLKKNAGAKVTPDTLEHLHQRAQALATQTFGGRR